MQMSKVESIELEFLREQNEDLKFKIAHLEGVIEGMLKIKELDDDTCVVRASQMTNSQLETLALELAEKEDIPVQKARFLIQSSKDIRKWERENGVDVDKGSPDDN